MGLAIWEAWRTAKIPGIHELKGLHKRPFGFIIIDSVHLGEKKHQYSLQGILEVYGFIEL